MDMNRKQIRVIGLMSGTSLDGIDLVYVEFSSESMNEFKIIESRTLDYSIEWREKLKSGLHLNPEELKLLDIDYGNLLGNEVKRFMSQCGIEKADFIASHGHTIFHQPEKGVTVQIGNGQRIADIANSKVVCDFRTQDVLLGGQGAPLVPIGDRILFSNYDACINLGGFANISFEQNNTRIAYDICPVNVVMNHYSQKLGYSYDDKGKLTSQGKIDQNALNELNSLDYYSKKAPKSLGVEWVNEYIFPILENVESPYDVLRTFVEHVSDQLAKSIEQFDLALFTGGGVYNEFLIHNLKNKVMTKIDIPNSIIVDYKEALIFALLGRLRLEGKNNCLSSVTGAEKDHSSGQIFHPN